MESKEQYIEEYINYLYGEDKEEEMYAPDVYQSRADFKAGWDACRKYFTEFEKGETVRVTDKDHKLTNFWFNREFVQQDSDGKFACKQIDGSICRWDYIRKNL